MVFYNHLGTLLIADDVQRVPMIHDGENAHHLVDTAGRPSDAYELTRREEGSHRLLRSRRAAPPHVRSRWVSADIAGLDGLIRSGGTVRVSAGRSYPARVCETQG